MLTLQTQRLILHDFLPEDFEAFYATTNDPEYRQFYSEYEMSREHLLDIFDRILLSGDPVLRTGYQLAVCLLDGQVIGTCGVRIEDAGHQQASMGCAIARPFWGKGYAYEAARRMLDFGFSSLPIHRIFAETISENSRSRALLERLGWRLEGELVHHRYFRSRWWNTVIYAILKEEWL